MPPDAIQFLARCRHGRQFTTYPTETSPTAAWATAAPDVGAVVRRALGLGWDQAALGAAHGLPPAYWWTSSLYTTAMALDGETHAVCPAARELLKRTVPAGAFDRALWIRAAVRIGVDAQLPAVELVDVQRGNGLWSGTARLRLPNGTSSTPWAEIDSGPLHTDTQGLFTTATAVASLGLVDMSSPRLEPVN